MCVSVKPEVYIECPGAEVTANFEPPKMGAGNRT